MWAACIPDQGLDADQTSVRTRVERVHILHLAQESAQGPGVASEGEDKHGYRLGPGRHLHLEHTLRLQRGSGVSAQKPLRNGTAEENSWGLVTARRSM